MERTATIDGIENAEIIADDTKAILKAISDSPELAFSALFKECLEIQYRAEQLLGVSIPYDIGFDITLLGMDIDKTKDDIAYLTSDKTRNRIKEILVIINEKGSDKAKSYISELRFYK